MMSEYPDHVQYIASHFTAAIWGLDMLRALQERPRLFQWAIRLLMGRYAWRELIGLRDELIKRGYGFSGNFNYGIEGANYHKDKTPWDLRCDDKEAND
ncbi:MAG: hypothetical protein ACYC36_13250 [Bellilinea sp.]